MLADKMIPLASALAAFAVTAAHAHTLFTTLTINGLDQGDGTCVRMPRNPANATFPVEDLASADMICGQDGLQAVGFTCPVPAAGGTSKKKRTTGATLSFTFRAVPNDPTAGSIDSSHKGPCAVYMKQLPAVASSSQLQTETSPSTGWFKIFEEGYDASAGKWCTEKIAAANGLLTVTLPAGLPGGAAYLVRPELLALHRAIEGDPQFYVGCAQIYVEPTDAEAAAIRQSKTSFVLDIPSQYAATIPGHVRAGEPSVSFNIYDATPSSFSSYEMPGPAVFVPSAAHVKTVKSAATVVVAAAAADADAASNQVLTAAAAGVELVPATCLVKNANWCGKEVASYSTEAGCWDASADCFLQEKACYDAAPPTGHANCAAWDEQKCSVIQAACQAGNFQGPPNKGQVLTSAYTD